MSIASAIMAHMTGDTSEAERQLARVTLKMAVSGLMFCPGRVCGGTILDVKRAVRVETADGNGAMTLCIECHDTWRATVSPAALAGLKIMDGRVLYARRPRKAAPRKSALLTGTATNVHTGATRPASLTEAQAAAILSDEEHDTCSGECECPVEPDGECPKGWPSRMRAVGMV